MHIKNRGARAMLYRSSWVPKGTNGNTHGYSTQTFVGSLSLDAEALPADLANKFSEAEVCYLEVKLFQPTRLAAQQRVRMAEHREADPMWRLDEAIRLTLDAAERSERSVVPNVKVAAVQSALSMVRTISQSQLEGQNAGQPSAPVTTPVAEQGRSDPLKDALAAIKAARDAVAAGKYGVAPAEGVRATYAYRKWAEIFDAIEGAGNDSLLRALQKKGLQRRGGNRVLICFISVPVYKVLTEESSSDCRFLIRSIFCSKALPCLLSIDHG